MGQYVSEKATPGVLDVVGRARCSDVRSWTSHISGVLRRALWMEEPSLSIHNVVMLAESGEVHRLAREDDVPRVGFDTTPAVRADGVGVVRVAHALRPVSHGDARRSQPLRVARVHHERTQLRALAIEADLGL
jgi:hypothetical protein